MTDNRAIPQELFDRIEQYILQTMTEAESLQFEKELLADQDLAQKVDELRLVFLGIGEHELRKKIPVFHQYQQPVSLWRRNIGWAAAILVIAVAAVWLFVFPLRRQNDLFGKYYAPDPGLITVMGASEEYDFDRAMIDYKTGKYSLAVKAWENMLLHQPSSDTLQYFTASAYLAMKEIKKSIPYFEKVVAIPDGAFYSDACWYLGLALLREGKTGEAVSWIERSSNSNKQSLLNQIK